MISDLSILPEISSLLHAQKYAEARTLVDARLEKDGHLLPVELELCGNTITRSTDTDGLNLFEIFGSASGAYALRVKDDSFREWRLMAGDMVVIERRNKARGMELVLASDVGGRLRIGTIMFNGGREWLMDSCDDSTRLPIREVRILGIVIGMVRGRTRCDTAHEAQGQVD